MSQFLMCKAKANLLQYGGKLLNTCEINNNFFVSVLTRYYAIDEYDDIWVIGNIHEYCNETLSYDDFFSSELFYLLNNIFDLCEWMIFWYGSEYDDLDKVYSKDELLNYVQHCIEKPCCQLYVRVIK